MVDFAMESVDVKKVVSDLEQIARGLGGNVAKASCYYLDIYRHCIEEMPSERSVIVDYGGGHGLFSFFAKRIGFKQVIYIDINPVSVKKVEELKQKTGYGPDVILCGDAPELKRWCQENKVVPNCLVSIDVIEHVYNLDTFFADLFAINPAMQMVFTTASNPCNALKVRRLRKAMIGDETGSREKPNFYTLRRDYIHSQYPDFEENTLNSWASATRGLVFDDIKAVVDGEKPLPIVDGYNTCDPRTGSWTERVLPIADYNYIVVNNDGTLVCKNGFYNKYSSWYKSLAAKVMNFFIYIFPKAGRCIAPFIFLKIN